MKIELTILPNSLDLTSTDLRDWLDQSKNIQPFSVFQFFKISDDPRTFRLKVEFLSGKTWKQDFIFTSPSDPDPGRTFSVSGFWTLADTIGLRDHTTFLLSFLTKYPSLESLKHEVS